MEMWEQAQKLHVEKKFDEARELYEELLTQNQGHTGLLASLGTLYLQTNKIGLAMTLLNIAVEKSSKPLSDVLSNLGLAYKYAGFPDQCRFWMEKAMSEDPSPEAMTNYAGTFVESGNPGKPIEILQKAIEAKPELALAHWNLAIALLEAGQWERGWKEYEWGIATGIRPDRYASVAPLWNGEKGTVLVYGEQGIGDEIMFGSMIPELMQTNDVVIECRDRLVKLYENSFGVPCIGTSDKTVTEWTGPKFDYRIAVGSLGKIYRNKREDFPGTPYLKAESAPKGEKFRVGISWTGGLKAGRVRKRTVPLSWWHSILSQNCEFVSLQYTPCEEEIAAVEAEGFKIAQFPEVKEGNDYYETAKLVQSCDLIITICTSVLHLAGALGKPCWVMTPKNPPWREGSVGPMPWYRSVRLYRQSESWVPVVEAIGRDLKSLLAEKGIHGSSVTPFKRPQALHQGGKNLVSGLPGHLSQPGSGRSDLRLSFAEIHEAG